MQHRWLVLFVLLALAGLFLIRGTAPPITPHVPSPAGLSLPAALPGAPAYTITDLGTLGASFSGASAINAAGQVVGESNVDPADPKPVHAFLWEEGQMGDLGARASGDSRAYALNTAGQVVGVARVRPEGANDAALWQNGAITDLGDLGGWQSEAHGINAKGQVVGWSKTDRGQLHAFLWEKGRMTDLGTLGGDKSLAWALNDAGQVVGEAELAGAHPRVHAFLWSNGRMHDLGTRGGKYSAAYCINNAGLIGGNARTASGASHACLWKKGVIQDLGSTGSVLSVNAVGQAVGELGPRAGLWQNGRVIDLQDRLPAGSGWKLQSAVSINNAGRIVGLGQHHGKTHAFLMSPQ